LPIGLNANVVLPNDTLKHSPPKYEITIVSVVYGMHSRI